MSLILDNKNTDGSRILIWKDEESLDFFRERVVLSPNDIIRLDKYTVERRQKDLLIARFLLQQLIPNAQVAYLESGKPYLENNNYKISISHTKDLVAVIVHPNKIVGLDIEYISPRVTKLKHRFLSDEERSLADNTETITLFWSAKECLFKMDDEQGLDFKSELKLQFADKNTLLGFIRSTNETKINYLKKDDWVLCFATR